MPDEFRAHFTDGSSCPVTIKGHPEPGSWIGLATRGDGFKRALFFDSTGRLDASDSWIEKVVRIVPEVQTSPFRRPQP